jgi:tetratricopeptide (TPR) repeat protein
MALLLGLVFAASAAAQAPPVPAPDPCAGDPRCRQASAAELFAAADAAAAEGDLLGAQHILEALTADPDPELRAEARFRLAAVREARGDLDGAVGALRELLAEKPQTQSARLELARILARQGKEGEAQRELRQAEAAGLPTDVARTVRRFSTSLGALKRRGASVELAVVADSNVNRGSGDLFIDTVIAPFELSPDARRQAGPGVSLGGVLWSRDSLLGATFLTRAGVYADLFPGKGRFNDIQLSLTSGPELATPLGRIRPALAYERRWFGGERYSAGYGGALNWQMLQSERDQVQLDAAIVHQSVHNSIVLDGTRYAAAVAWDHAFTPETSTRLTVRGAVLDAFVRPESLRLAGGDLLAAHRFPPATLFAQAGYTRTWGLARLLLFGKTRADDRIDLTAGVIVHRLEFSGFTPLARLIYTRSRSNIEIYDYARVRLEIGVTREF